MFFGRKKDKQDKPILAIDFGTTNSVMAACINGIPQVIPNAEGETITPSLAIFNNESKVWLVGKTAKIKSTVSSTPLISAIKRKLGQCPECGGKRNRHILPYKKAN